jgi:hypothetical protein
MIKLFCTASIEFVEVQAEPASKAKYSSLLNAFLGSERALKE